MPCSHSGINHRSDMCAVPYDNTPRICLPANGGHTFCSASTDVKLLLAAMPGQSATWPASPNVESPIPASQHWHSTVSVLLGTCAARHGKAADAAMGCLQHSLMLVMDALCCSMSASAAADSSEIACEASDNSLMCVFLASAVHSFLTSCAAPYGISMGDTYCELVCILTCVCTLDLSSAL